MMVVLLEAMLCVGPPTFAGDDNAGPPASAAAVSRTVSFAEFSPAADGKTDDTPALNRCFAEVAARGGGVVVIPPGDYFISAAPPTVIPSHTTVTAYGARFFLPQRLGGKDRVLVMFQGRNVTHFAWHGGEFIGHCFDPARQENSWEPNVSTRIFAVTTSPDGTTSDLTFRDIHSDGIAGAVVNVEGALKPGSEREVTTLAQRVRVEGCTLLRSGKFMWDYGYLWQIIVWPEDYQPWEVQRALGYFRKDLIRRGVQMTDGDDRARFDNRQRPITVSPSAEPRHALCFFGGTLPKNIVRGRQYYVVEAGTDYVKVSDKCGGRPIRFQGDAGPGIQLIHDLLGAFNGLYAPTGAGPGKGGVDVVGAGDVRISGCQLSALGDTMHVQRCRNVVFAGNHILGSRMGAFFLAEYCKNATITGNLVDGTNGSRVMSVEKSCEDVTITGNTFRGGGRGSWINQPKNFILQGNVFVDNTTKGEADPRRGRRVYETGEYGRFPELYFTVHQQNGCYGPVIVRDNIFALGESCADPAVTFAANGHDLQMSGNVFQNHPTTIRVDGSCTGAAIQDNVGAELERKATDAQNGKR